MKLHSCNTHFIQFLQDELAITESELTIARRHPVLDNGSLAMSLWQYGLISLDQLARIFDWLEESLTHRCSC